MSTALKGLVAVVAIAVVAFVWWTVRDRESRSIAPHAAELAPESAAAEDAPPALDSSTRVAPSVGELATPAIQQPSGAARIEGRVLVREDEQPFARAHVRCQSKGIWSTTTADEAGRYAFEFDRAAKIDRVAVAATDATAATFQYVALYLRSGETITHDVWVTRGASLSGRVVDLEHRAVPGAEVLGWCSYDYDPDSPPDRRASAGEDGSFTLAHFGAYFQVTARAPGMGGHTGLQGHLAAGQVAEGLELVLAPAVPLRGRVVADGDEPVAGAEIEIGQHGWSSEDDTEVEGVRRFMPALARAKSDLAGRFAFDGLPLSRDLQAHADHSDHPPWQGYLVAGGDEQVIRLAPGCELRGRVFARGGAAIAGADISLRPGTSHTTTKSDASGSFRLRGLAPTDEGLLLVHADGFAVFARSPLEIREGQPAWIDVPLEPGRALAGRVVDRDEHPLAGWRLEIVGERVLTLPGVIIAGETTTPEWAFGLQRAKSDENGAFRFVDLLDGEYLVSARSPDASELHGEARALAGREDVLVRIDPDAQQNVEFVGRVTDAVTGAPVREFVVTPMITEGGISQGSNIDVVDDDGRFRLADLPKARIDLHVEAEGYAEWSNGARDYEFGRYEFDAALLATRTVRVRAVDANMQPVTGSVFVSFHTLDERRLSIRLNRTTTATSTNLVDGEATAAGLPAALLRVKFESPDRHQDRTFDLDLRVEPREPLQFVLDFAPEPGLTVVVFGAARATAEELGDAPFEPERTRELMETHALWLIDARTELRFENATGTSLAAATIELQDDGLYATHWTRVTESGKARDRSEPVLSLTLPAAAVRVRVQATGYGERVVPLVLPRDKALPIVLARNE